MPKLLSVPVGGSEFARELSLGQRMRADLGLALVSEPELLLLDEPTLGLDVLARRRILEFIRDLNRERGLSVLVTSHDMAAPPILSGAQLVRGEASRHTYTFDASHRKLADLVDQASASATVVDVETHRPAIDDVVADLYEHWLRSPAEPR
jgi:ABC-2 type transport system ATP-binding protein